MKKDITPEEDYLKAVTGKFDLDTIFYLNLPQKGIVRLSSILDCCSLILLDLSKNKIGSVSGISKLKSLNFLDLSFNSISKIDDISKLTNLRHLKLHGNNISSIPDDFKMLKKLEKLTFQILPYEQDKSINTSNPVCKQSDYRQNILDQLPNLRMLDCISREMEPFSVEDGNEAKEMMDKLDPKNFKFEFENDIKFDINELITDSDIKNAQKMIDEKYEEFEKGVEDLKKVLDDIK